MPELILYIFFKKILLSLLPNQTGETIKKI
jgi:hypothetical protein